MDQQQAHQQTQQQQTQAAAAGDPVTELLGAEFKGQVIRPEDAGYDETRALYNGMIDKRPAYIVRPTGAADIVDAVNAARDRGLELAVRCGGHSVAGHGTCDGGILIDLSSLKGVWVDPDTRTARANAGALWGEFDRETQMFGLATPGGRMTTTGVGGFTLGGGYGWLSPKYGLASDNLVSANVVTADGRLVTASETEHPDLFWGLRGGGGNFGIVTSYAFRLHTVGPIVQAGLLIHPYDAAPELLRGYRDYVESAPEELSTAVSTLLAPPEPFVPQHLHGKPVLAMIVLYIGDPGEGREAIAPLRELADPAVDMVDAMPYTAAQALVDPFSPRGWLNYWRGEYLAGFSDAAIDAYASPDTEPPSPMSFKIVFRHGGEVSRIGDDGGAAGHRDAAYMAHPIGCWSDPADTERHMAWVRRFSETMRPFTTGGLYLNFEVDAEEQRVKAGHGAERYARLTALKDEWDPDNLFHINQNIRPSRHERRLAAA